jgi:hypothetical protein
VPAPQRALAWIDAHRVPGGGGVVPYSGHTQATQEVTGYLIPTLCDHGQRDLALELTRWLIAVQRADGAFAAIDGVPYTFDTAQAARGLLAMLDELPEAEHALQRACDFIVSQIDAGGMVHTPSYGQWQCADGSVFSEYANLYVLPPLVGAGERLGRRDYEDAAARALDRFRRQRDLTRLAPGLATMTHIFGYMMEALVELGENDLAREGLAQAAALQAPDGAIPAYPGASWICSTGLAQLALAWYRLGEPVPADAALACLESLQNPSGGFYGSYGPGACYFPAREISWAVKFYLDGVTWRNRLRARSRPTPPDVRAGKEAGLLAARMAAAPGGEGA